MRAPHVSHVMRTTLPGRPPAFVHLRYALGTGELEVRAESRPGVPGELLAYTDAATLPPGFTGRDLAEAGAALLTLADLATA